MKTSLGLVLVASLFAHSAFAEDVYVDEPVSRRGQGWSVLSGKTVGNGATVFGAELGWPGVSASLLHGVAPKLDLGARFSFNYGEEGIVTRVVPGLKLQGLVRVQLVETQRLNLGLHFEPGPMFYFWGPAARVGLALPFGFAVGLPVGSAVMLNFGLDFPMHVFFGPGGGLNFPVLIGAGLEYFVSSNLAVTFDLRMGPTLGAVGYYEYYYDDYRRLRGYYAAPFTMKAMFGIAYRF